MTARRTPALRPFGRGAGSGARLRRDSDRASTRDRAARVLHATPRCGYWWAAAGRRAHRGAAARAGADRGKDGSRTVGRWSARQPQCGAAARDRRCRSTRRSLQPRRRTRRDRSDRARRWANAARAAAADRPRPARLARTPSCDAATKRSRRCSTRWLVEGSVRARRRAGGRRCDGDARPAGGISRLSCACPACGDAARSSRRPRGCGPGAARRTAARAAARGARAGVALRLDREPKSSPSLRRAAPDTSR